MRIAIDGPAGSGKSTVCKILAEKYGLIYLDTGAMYRAVTWFEEKFGSANLIENIKNTDFIFTDNGKKLTVVFKGTDYDVTEVIRTPRISAEVSRTAANSEIRRELVKKQRACAKKGGVIMEGRDITTVVLPEADIKVFLTAKAEERAKRRFAQWGEKPGMPTYEEVLESIKKRDAADSARECSPLAVSRDAVFIDTTEMTLEEAAKAVGRLIEEKKAKK